MILCPEIVASHVTNGNGEAGQIGHQKLFGATLSSVQVFWGWRCNTAIGKAASALYSPMTWAFLGMVSTCYDKEADRNTRLSFTWLKTQPLSIKV